MSSFATLCTGFALRFAYVAAWFAVFVVTAGPPARAQELEPRTYSNTPIGLNFLIAGYSYSEGGVATDPSLPLEDTNVRLHSTVFAYARSLNVWGKSGKFDVVLPYAWASGTATLADQSRNREISGFADGRFRFSVNLYGAPALTLREYAHYKQNVIVGTSLQVGAPVGQYDASKLLNIGTNRWTVKPELGVSKALGPLTVELAAGVTFYAENDDFLGGHSREQSPIYSLQGHLIYSFGRGIWGAVDGTYYTGGRPTIDGVEGSDLQESTRLGATLALPVNRYNSIKLYASTGVSARTGTDFDAIGIAWQYRFGGGL